MRGDSDIISLILAPLKEFILKKTRDVVSGAFPIKLPIIPEECLIQICHLAQSLMKSQETVLSLESPQVIIGDLHGHVFDLFRIVKKCGLPPASSYLFLGDLVDRGEFSLETASIVLAMKCRWPEHVNIIRGNHEFGEICEVNGFLKEIFETYNANHLYRAFRTAFSYIPLGAVIDNDTLCIHGGIGPSLFLIEQIAGIKRPVNTFHDDIVGSIVWSDPVESEIDFQPSSRGSGFLFNESALLTFLRSSGMRRIIRGHECVENGYKEMFGSRLITVFSASNYCGTEGNSAAIFITSKNGGTAARFAPSAYFKRTDAQFYDPTTNFKKPMKRRMTTSVSSTFIEKPGKTILSGEISSHCKKKLSMSPQVSRPTFSVSTHNLGHEPISM